MKRHLIIIIATVFVILAGALLIVLLHHENKIEVLSQFQDHQLVHAQHLAHQIESFFHVRSKELQALSSLVSRESGGLKKKRVAIETYSKMMEYVKAISLYNEVGAIVYSTDSNAIGLDHGDREFFSWAKKKENKGKVFGLFLFQPDSFMYLFAVPLYQDSFDANDPEPSGKFVGVLTLIVDLKEFFANQLHFLDPKINLHQVWIMDRDGRLLFQSVHKEMVQRSIYERDESCSQCHISFDYVEKILREKHGTVDYQARNLRKKIAAFAPMEFEDASVSWIVVVSSLSDEVTALVRKSLRDDLMLLGLIFFAFLAGSVLAIRNDRLKIRAEEESKHWQEQIAERKKAEEALQLERNKFRSILDRMADGVYIVDQQYNIEYTNPVIEKEFGLVNGRKCYEYFHDRMEVCPWCKNQEVFAGNSVQWEWHSFKTDKTYDLFDTPIPNTHGTISKLEIFHDVTERKQAEEALRESEMKYRIVADNTYDWEWWRHPEGNFIYVSPSCKKVTHHEAEEFITDPDLLLKIIHPDDKSSFIRHQIEVEQKHSSGEIEFRILRPNGSLRWIAHGCQPVFDEQGRFLGRRGSNRDITEHKWADEALRESEKQLRYLSSQLLTAQEAERRRISRELHDELGGALAVLKLRSSFIEKNLQKDQIELREECKQNLQYIDQIIEDVGRLSRDLSPSILEDLGLSAALRWLIDNFVKNYNIKIASDIVDVDHLFPKDAQIMIYRIFQEALTNIGKHAQAKNVSTKVKKDEDRISFFVEDDGKGFDVKHAATKEASEKGLGLATMDERARMLGGSLDLWSEEGKGTRITLSVTIKRGESL